MSGFPINGRQNRTILKKALIRNACGLFLTLTFGFYQVLGLANSVTALRIFEIVVAGFLAGLFAYETVYAAVKLWFWRSNHAD